MPKTVLLSIRSLCEFLLRGGSIDARFQGLDRATEGSRIHRMLQKQGGKHYTAEVALSQDLPLDGFFFRLTGRADGIITENDTLTVDEIKTTARDVDDLDENANPAHWAQARCYAHILCAQQGYTQIGVRLTYYQTDTGAIRRFTRQYTAEELAAFVAGLLHQYLRWAKLEQNLRTTRDTALRNLNFPFEGYRDGQRDMAIAVYQTCKTGGRLFCCAPTGIGKTLSTLFPSLKAMGEGYGERIFYLTAKTITRTAAENALALLREHAGGALPLRCITLTAKDKVCFLEERACTPETCEWANGYYNRINDALYKILQTETILPREGIEALARQYRLCPYELSLDLALWCDVITCDYNYLFDPVVHLQRFFEGNGGEHIFLVDEAHNLIERSRDMYSAGLSKSSFAAFKKELPRQPAPPFKALHTALNALNKAFIVLRKRCEAAEEQTLPQTLQPVELLPPLEKFCAATEKYLEHNRGSEWEKDLLALYFEALFYNRISEQYADNYITLLHTTSLDTRVRLFCLDPSPFLDESMSKGRASVLFSATLQPLPYYRETLGGGPTAKLLALPSPFAQKNLGLYVAGGVSTKYAHRPATLPHVAELLAALAQSQPGNYIAYFPSYSYLRQVLETFETLHPHISTLVQQPGMDEAARENFLATFAPNPKTTLLGFCVLGGIFAEGVDLEGSRLIGTAVVGVGLPQIGPEPDAIRRYYDQKNGDGFSFAYQFPGMNKVLQAAGRVIRGQHETGVVLLIDSRFPTYRYQTMFPPHWNHWQPVTAETIAPALAAYWQQTRRKQNREIQAN